MATQNIPTSSNSNGNSGSVSPQTYKGAIDASTNPAYPAASLGDTYIISADGTLGGGGENITFQDAFTRSNSASIGNNWIEKTSAAFAITNNVVTKDGAGTGYRDNLVYRPSGEVFVDGEASVEIKFSAVPGGYPQIFVRGQASSIATAGSLDSYSLYITDSVSVANLQRIEGTGFTNLADITISPVLNTTDTFRLRLKAIGTNPVVINAYIEKYNTGAWDIIGQASVNDSSGSRLTTAGTVGFTGYTETGTYTYNNFTVTIPGSGEPVIAGDTLICNTTTGAGNHADVGSNWDIISSPSSGSVLGPSSSTANAVMRFSGTTGKVAQNSSVLIDTSNNIIAPNYRIGDSSRIAPQIVYVGDSLTQGYGGTPYSDILTLPTWNSLTFTATNIAVFGRTVLTMLQNTGANFNPLYGSETGMNIAVIWGGTNDMATGTSPAQTFSYLQAFCKHQQLLGWKIIVVTMISRVGEDSHKNTYNGYIKNYWPLFADGIVDLTVDTNLGSDGAYSNITYFNGDQIHLTNTSNTLVAGYIQTAIESLVAGNSSSSPLLTNMTSSRSLNTTYNQLSATKSLLVMATLRCAISLAGGVATVQAKMDQSSPPTTSASGIIGIQSGLLSENNTFQLCFLVPNGVNNKYRIDSVQTNGTVTLGSWFEITI